MSDEAGGNDLYTPAQLREHLDGYHERDPDAHPAAGIVQDQQVNRYLSILDQHYDPTEADDPSAMPGTAQGLEEVQHIRTVAASERAREAMQNGDMEMAKHLTGDQNERADISGINAISEIDQIIESPAPVIVILGKMGTGKTDFACLLAQRAKHLLGVEQVASNVGSLKETTAWTDGDGEPHDGYVADYETLVEWVEQDGDPRDDDNRQSQKLYLGDEWSSVGGGSGTDGYLMRQRLGPLVYKIRKYNGLLIYIAHDPSSIHPLLWRLGVIIQKLDKKTARIAEKVKAGEVRGEKFQVTGIPPTDWRYDTKDTSEWSWTDGEEEYSPGEAAKDVAIWTVIHCKQEGMTNRETAQFVPYTHGWVGSRWREYTEEGEHENIVSKVEGLTA